MVDLSALQYDNAKLDELKKQVEKMLEDQEKVDERVRILETVENKPLLERKATLVSNGDKELIDQKLDKEEFANFVSMLNEETLAPM